MLHGAMSPRSATPVSRTPSDVSDISTATIRRTPHVARDEVLRRPKTEVATPLRRMAMAMVTQVLVAIDPEPDQSATAVTPPPSAMMDALVPNIAVDLLEAESTV